MKVNEQRKQAYLNGEVGILFNEYSDHVELRQVLGFVPDTYASYYQGLKQPPVIHQVSWFFEEDEESSSYSGGTYQRLFDYMKDEHDVTLLETDMQEIIRIVQDMYPTKPEPSRLDIIVNLMAGRLSNNNACDVNEDVINGIIALADQIIKQSKL